MPASPRLLVVALQDSLHPLTWIVFNLDPMDPVDPSATSDRTSSIAQPKQTIFVSDADVNIVGIDCIWHNMDTRSDFRVFRKWYFCDLGHLLVFIADRVRHKIFEPLSVNATKNMVVVTIACQKSGKEMFDKWLDTDYWISRDGVYMEHLLSDPAS